MECWRSQWFLLTTLVMNHNWKRCCLHVVSDIRVTKSAADVLVVGLGPLYHHVFVVLPVRSVVNFFVAVELEKLLVLNLHLKNFVVYLVLQRILRQRCRRHYRRYYLRHCRQSFQIRSRWNPINQPNSRPKREYRRRWGSLLSGHIDS